MRKKAIPAVEWKRPERVEIVWARDNFLLFFPIKKEKVLVK